MSDLPKYITDENTGLKYELVGDYYFLAGDDEPDEEIHIGMFGQLRHKYLRENKKCIFTAMLLSGKLMQHLKETDEHANEMLSQIVSQMAKAEGVTEQLKQQDQLKWIGLMENIHNRAMEIVCADIIYV